VSGLRISLSRPADLAAPAAAWRALEARADGSFFQSWTWVGCRAAERFADPVLLRADGGGGGPVGLALLNRRRGLFLAESGRPGLDSVHVEHNGVLLARGHEAALAACLRALLAQGRLVLSGTDAAHLAAARHAGAVRLRRSAPAPYVDLAALGGRDFLAGLSANTRAQLRRSERAYGPVAVRPAADVDEARAFLETLAVLHQARWTARGQPGAFANPAFRRFHAELLARAVPRGEAALLRVSAGGAVIGYLYNFMYRGRVLAYQSGFDYAAAPPRAKPGLTCHRAAIVQAAREGMAAYDFLAGGDRYKTSLADKSATLHWLEVAPRWSPRGLAWRMLNTMPG